MPYTALSTSTSAGCVCGCFGYAFTLPNIFKLIFFCFHSSFLHRITIVMRLITQMFEFINRVEQRQPAAVRQRKCVWTVNITKIRLARIKTKMIRFLVGEQHPDTPSPGKKSTNKWTRGKRKKNRWTTKKSSKMGETRESTWKSVIWFSGGTTGGFNAFAMPVECKYSAIRMGCGVFYYTNAIFKWAKKEKQTNSS